MGQSIDILCLSIEVFGKGMPEQMYGCFFDIPGMIIIFNIILDGAFGKPDLFRAAEQAIIFRKLKQVYVIS